MNYLMWKKCWELNESFETEHCPTGRETAAVQVLKATEDEPAINPPAGQQKHILQQKAAIG